MNGFSDVTLWSCDIATRHYALAIDSKCKFESKIKPELKFSAVQTSLWIELIFV